LSTPPPVMIFFINTPLFNKYNLSSIKIFICGAAPISGETETKLKSKFKHEIYINQIYGQTETTLGVVCRSFGWSKPGSVGGVVKGTYVKVVDLDGKTLGKNEAGEILVKGNSVMKGFYNNPHATADTIDKDGWLHTGDVGYYDDDLQFFIVDRLKELIKYKGFQVPPAELEGLLLTHPKIIDCGIIGIPDERAGELPFAFVVKHPNAQITESEVKEFVEKHASNSKWLRGGVKFINEIPKNPTGKILRRELRELYNSMRAKL
jgi:4-coumarate--CoA ligase